MKAVEGKLDKKGLADLFIMIDYKVMIIYFKNDRFHKNNLMKWFKEYLVKRNKYANEKWNYESAVLRQ